MQTFEQFLENSAGKGELVNIIFEQRLFDLVGVLRKITGALTAAEVPHELIGGLAVLVHVEQADPAHSVLTRGVDLMIRRPDLERVKEIAEDQGFRFRHAAGVDMLLYGGSGARNPVHLIFSGEKSPAEPSHAQSVDRTGAMHHPGGGGSGDSTGRPAAHETERFQG